MASNAESEESSHKITASHAMLRQTVLQIKRPEPSAITCRKLTEVLSLAINISASHSVHSSIFS